MKTIILTVPHSGTNFLIRFLVGVLGLDTNGDAEGVTAESSVDFSHTHPSSSLSEKMPIQDGIFDAAIITLRHPYKSAQTGKLGGASCAQLEDGYRELIKQIKRYKTVLFVCIDGPEENRFSELMAVAKHFGKEDLEPAIRKYSDDWKPVNTSLTDDDKNALGFAVQMYEQWR